MQAVEPEETLIDQNKVIRKKLSTDVTITLHTNIAQSLFKGSWRPGKMGLLQFSSAIIHIWNAARNDDPYADWYLLKTYQALCDARENLNVIEAQLTPYLNNLRGITIGSCSSVKPIQHPLQFSTPFGFMGAYLIADFDYVLRQHLMLERLGIPLKEDITIKRLVELVQKVFSVPRGWQQTGVTRKDVLESTLKAVHAKEKLGEIPPAILNKEIKFAFLPKSIRKPV